MDPLTAQQLQILCRHFTTTYFTFRIIIGWAMSYLSIRVSRVEFVSFFDSHFSNTQIMTNLCGKVSDWYWYIGIPAFKAVLLPALWLQLPPGLNSRVFFPVIKQVITR